MVERDDDDEQTMRQAFAVLRRHVVRVSADFGARLAVRLLALSAARSKGDPALLAVFGQTMAEAVSIALAPLASTKLPREDRPAEDKDDDDERS